MYLPQKEINVFKPFNKFTFQSFAPYLLVNEMTTSAVSKTSLYTDAEFQRSIWIRTSYPKNWPVYSDMN